MKSYHIELKYPSKENVRKLYAAVLTYIDERGGTIFPEIQCEDKFRSAQTYRLARYTLELVVWGYNQVHYNIRLRVDPHPVPEFEKELSDLVKNIPYEKDEPFAVFDVIGDKIAVLKKRL